MSDRPDAISSVTVTKVVAIRVRAAVDIQVCRQLEHILTDLIFSQGVTDLLVDLSAVDHVVPELKGILARADEGARLLGGSIDYRIPNQPPEGLRGLTPDKATFSPLATSPER